MSASAQGAKRVARPIDRVQRRTGTTSSRASFASRAPAELANGPRYMAPSARAPCTSFSRGNASRGVELQVGVAAPALPAAVVAGLVLADQAGLQDEGFELGRAARTPSTVVTWARRSATFLRASP